MYRNSHSEYEVMVICPKCNEEMIYDGDGEWVCINCGEVMYTGFDDEDESLEESLSLDEAALIWGSNGMDEDYEFGYSEEDLSNELN